MLRKKLLKLILSTSLVLSVFGTTFIQPPKAHAFAGGSGTESDPYLVSNTTDFLNITNSASSHYKLTNDIDLTNVSFNGFGIGSSSWFTGSLDGNNYKIINMTINKPTNSYVGLFGSIYKNSSGLSGTIKNITFVNPNVTGGQYTGIIAGDFRSWSSATANYGEINNVRIIGGKVQSSYSQYVGGIIGGNSSANYLNAKNIVSEIDVSVTNTSNSTTISYVGGVMGYGGYVIYDNIETSGKITITPNSTSYATQYIGGISGYESYSKFTNINNKNDIEIKNGGSNITRIGGISGYSTSIQSGTTNITNYGNITTTNSIGSASDIGGIFGYESGNGTRNYLTNQGNIKITSTSTGAVSQIGGITGETSDNGSASAYDFLNNGNITISNTGSINQVGGLFGYYYNSSGTTYIYNPQSNSDIDLTVTNTSYSTTEVGGIVGYVQSYSSNTYFYDSSTSGKIYIKRPNNTSSDNYIGGIVGNTYGYYRSCSDYTDPNTGETTTSCSNYSNASYNRFYQGLSTVDINVSGGGSGNNKPAGLGGYSVYSYNYNMVALNTNINSNSGQGYANDYSSCSTCTNIKYLNTLTGTTYNGAAITSAQAKSWATYSAISWLTTNWGIKEGSSYPYLLKNSPSIESIVTPDGTQLQTLSINLDWTDKTEGKTTSGYDIIIEKMVPTATTWSSVSTFTSSTSNYTFNIPAGTPGNTKFRWKVRGKNASVTGHYYQFNEFVFTNNISTITGSYTIAEKDLTTSLDKRTMGFSLNSIVDPDNFNFITFYAEIEGVAGSKQKIKLGTDASGNLPGPVNFNTKTNYKLKLIPKFSSSSSKYDLLVVDAADENIVLATLVSNRAMQAVNAPSPESFVFKIYAEEYQNTNSSKIATSNELKQTITVDTRNYLPSISNVTNDINGRTFSGNQGYNKITFTAKVADMDPEDNVDTYFAVKTKNDKVAGKYVVNPATDKKIKSFTPGATGVSGTFTDTFVVSDNYAAGDYVLLIYGYDSRGGIGDPYIIDFVIDRNNPDIRFYADYNGNRLSTSERQVVAKDYNTKLYFTVYNYTTFEYAAYLIKPDQQKSDGTYVSLKTRGAFTNDVSTKFIGIDLHDNKFGKGDMVLFRFKATSSTGALIEKDVRIKIGEESNPLTDLADSKIPTPLLIK